MNPIHRITVIGILAFAAPALAEDKYKSPEGQFSVAFPGKPTESTQEVKTPIGPLTMHIIGYEKKNELGMMIAYNDYPAAVANEKPQAVLVRTRDGTKGPDGKVLEDKEITLGKDAVPGRAYTLVKGDDHFLRIRTYLKGPRLYQIIVSGSKKETVMSKEAEQFLDSFEISK